MCSDNDFDTLSWRESLFRSVVQQRQSEIFCDTVIMNSDGKGSIPAEELSPQYASKLTEAAKALNIIPLYSVTKLIQKNILAAERCGEIHSVEDRCTTKYMKPSCFEPATLMGDITYEAKTESAKDTTIIQSGCDGEIERNTGTGSSPRHDNASEKTGRTNEHNQPVARSYEINRPISEDKSTMSNTDDVSITPDDSSLKETVTTKQPNRTQVPQQKKNISQFKCTECTKEFSTCRSFRRHQLTFHLTPETRHQLEGTVPCPICYKMFTSVGNMRRHCKVHDETTPYKCAFCDILFTRKGLLKRHEKRHTVNRTVRPNNQREPPVKCSHCNTTFRLLVDLTRHQSASDGDRPLTCSTCGKTFLCPTALESHELSHTGDFRHRCETCGKVFRTVDGLNIHLLIHNLDSHKQCSVCSKTFGNVCDLSVHMRTHNGERPFLCSACGVSFTQHSHLKVHSRKHTGEKPFVCNVCGRGFAQTGGLASHRLTHSGEKPHMCPTCGKQFRTSTSYSQHQRTHSDGKGYRCSHCARTFADQTTMERHLKTHNGAQKCSKQPVCTTCGKQFRFYSSLSMHKMKHTGEKPYQCPLCGWKFRSSSNRKRHMRTQHYSGGVKPFKCDVCGHAFSRAVQRAVHLKRLHGVTRQMVQTEKQVTIPDSIPENATVDAESEYWSIGNVLDLTAFSLNFER